MKSLKELLGAIHESLELSTDQELREAVKLIIEVQDMDSAQCDCLIAAYENGPLEAGDLPSKAGRNELVEGGYLSMIVVKGQDGFNACTHKGAWAYRLLKALEGKF